MKYAPYTLQNFNDIQGIKNLSEEERLAIRVVGQVLPFRTNNYVVNELIDWNNLCDESIFILNFPQKAMLKPHHFDEMAAVLRKNSSKAEIEAIANKIRYQLNPNPAGQMDHNTPTLGNVRLTGLQHKYKETVLFFPSHGQTCHAYCTFCFRWPQFVGMKDLKFSMKETDTLIQYVRQSPEVTDVLFTGGDPLVMKTKLLASYIEPLLEAKIPNLKTIRIGTKALGFWPYRFLTDIDSDELLSLFRKVNEKGILLAIIAHFNHPKELSTIAVKQAIKRILATGAQIRTQSPLLRYINDRPEIWEQMWKEQVNLGCIPYYMFVVRDTGAHHFFSVPLVRAWQIYTEAYRKVNGLARTVQGPSMSTDPGKIQILGVSDIKGKKVIVMRLLQGRNPDWVGRPFLAEYDETATWMDELVPAFGEEKFFFEDELEKIYIQQNRSGYPSEL
jgi:KamA family protein